MTLALNRTTCVKYLRKAINSQFQWEPSRFIELTAEVWELNAQGERDSDHLGLKEDELLIKVVKKVCLVLLGVKFWKKQDQLKTEWLAAGKFFDLAGNVSSAFSRIVKKSAWSVIAQSFSDNQGNQHREESFNLGGNRKEKFLSALAKNINGLFDQSPGLKRNQLNHVLENATHKHDLMDSVVKIINTLLEKQLELKESAPAQGGE